ncbi:hypothetical protein [Marinococcus luteus]|uniref:hypothetical protein n=1 Tax=Marinococcus luteus TaxID=1122204 RepID=UPI002ACC54ED|nr:hypothetical protein [Marinococcus luteus]MDZ5783104.1 hypothetical protein [Marinococcus luteus]
MPEEKKQTIQTDGTVLQAVADEPPAIEAESGDSVEIHFENDRSPDRIVGWWRRGEAREKTETIEKKIFGSAGKGRNVYT